ncbi:MAG: hypothetical protein EPN93_07805 [Spirochaetes bacterium]|nr:MAG: hypothetical protein EPN93_07805 [Spirochaetota bacterium]
MTQKQNLQRLLLAGMVVCAAGGFGLHYRIHDIAKLSANYIPFFSGLASIFVIPALFMSRKTISYGYVLNGLTVILGTVIMAHFSIAHLMHQHEPQPVTLYVIVFGTTLPDILILWAKFFIGKALFDLEMFGGDLKAARGGLWYRYPNMGWWMVHLAAITLVYTIGHMIWG